MAFSFYQIIIEQAGLFI